MPDKANVNICSRNVPQTQVNALLQIGSLEHYGIYHNDKLKDTRGNRSHKQESGEEETLETSTED